MNTNQLNIKTSISSQRSRLITTAAKNWLKDKGYNNVIVHCTRGTFHVTNATNYMMTAKYILESATGLEFVGLNAYMARLVYSNLQPVPLKD